MLQTLISFLAVVFAAEISVSQITVSVEERDNFIEGSVNGDLAKTAQWAAFKPSPYVYSEDYISDGKNAFIVAGVNPTERLKKINGITGVTLSQLEMRMMGPPKFAERNIASLNTAWKGINNSGIRRSNHGFLGREKLRDRLIQDNNSVLGKRLTHQRVAEPLLAAVLAFEKAQADCEFDFAGKKFKIKAKKMGGGLNFFKSGDPRLSSRSGWIGFGMQGSPFRDELFANWYFEIVPASGGKGIRGDALTAHLIHRYGFYQGGKFRMDPNAIISLFSLR